jgi:UDP-N-acetylglucosamine acyltransferase
VTEIHQQALVDPTAEIDEDVSIGPFSVIGPDVRIAAGTRIASHVVINGPTRIGKHNEIFQFASLGDAPQDIGYQGEPTRLEIGDHNVIRESCTISRGTVHGGGVTRFGSHNFMMAYAHVAHDCQVGDHGIFANGASLGGHVELGDYVTLGGYALIHQHVRVGSYSFCGMGAGVSKDVPPYMMIAGHPAQPHGLNAVGLKRRGFDREQIKRLRQAYKLLYLSGMKLDDAVQAIEQLDSNCDRLAALVNFIKSSKRSIVR